MIFAMLPLEVAPSVLAADLGRLREQVETVEGRGRAGDPRRRHGRALRPAGRPGAGRRRGAAGHRPASRGAPHGRSPGADQIAAFAEAGAETIYVHAEATPHLNYALQQIRDAGCLAGLALTPSTPLDVFGEVDVDLASA